LFEVLRGSTKVTCPPGAEVQSPPKSGEAVGTTVASEIDGSRVTQNLPETGLVTFTTFFDRVTEVPPAI